MARLSRWPLETDRLLPQFAPSLSRHDIQSGIRDCVEAVAEDVAARQVVPFIKRVAISP